MEFNCTFSKSTSTDCQSITITDTSNYGVGVNDNNYVVSSFPTRTFFMKDVFGNTLATTTVSSPTISVTFDISNLLSLTQIRLDITLILNAIGSSPYQTSKPYTLPCII